MDITRQLKALQGNRCGICGETFDQDEIVDHDHGSGMIRGLLCAGCNQQEGRHKHCEISGGHCPICLWRETPSVAWLGWTERYESPFPVRDEREWRYRYLTWDPTSARALEAKAVTARHAAVVAQMFSRTTTEEFSP
jgi:Recombination endonuclease VII